MINNQDRDQSGNSLDISYRRASINLNPAV
jgi:hypothetical protein